MPLFGAAIESLEDHVAKHNAMVADLKKRLFEGIVEFTYEKGDGTVRPARGTMKVDLLPKTEPGKKFKLWDIVSSEGKKVPKRMTLFIPDSKLSEFENEPDAVSAALDEALGFEFNGSYIYFEADEKKKMPDGSVFYYDLDKNEFRSFKTDRLVEVK